MTTRDEEISQHEDEVHQLSEVCRSACADYLKYLESILEPALTELEETTRARRLTLHQVIGANLCVAHAVDYIQAIRAADGIKEKRSELITKFDAEFSIDGTRIQGGKMTLVDAVNNAMKHIRINPNRYEDLVQKYGQLSFECLVAYEGRVLCILDGFRFDYVRAVLLPAFRALRGWQFDDEVDVLEFARGGLVFDSGGWCACEEDDPIDAIIDAVNPTCLNCDESEDECVCAEYVFDGRAGEFEARFTSSAELDTLFSEVSGAYRRDRLITSSPAIKDLIDEE